MSADDLADRLDAVERAITDDDTDLTDVRTAATLTDEVERLERRVADLEATVEELDAAVEAVRGYAGNVRAVNRDVERRASAALAKVEALEAAVDAETVPGDALAHRATDAGAARGSAPAGTPGMNDRADQHDRATAPEPRDGDGQPRRPNSQSERGGDSADGASERARRPVTESRSVDPPATGRTDVNEPPQSGGETAPIDRRPDRPASRTAGAETDDPEDDASGTEQFIERVRDAL